MEKFSCITCLKPKANLVCGLCANPVCKNCAQFLEEGSFSFLTEIPAELQHGVYCGRCFDGKVAQPQKDYNQIMEKAKDVLVFYKTQNKETHFIRRTEEPFKIQQCADRDELILRMAFHAVRANFNAIIDVSLSSKKVRNGSYQTQIWSGMGTPAQVENSRLLKDRSLRTQPN